MYEKLKSLVMDDHIFFGLIVIIVAVGSFGLGRASVTVRTDLSPRVQLVASTKTAVPAEKTIANSNLDTSPSISTDENVAKLSTDKSSNEKLVASKSGTKYHLPSCPGAKQIKEENKIYFDTPQAAEAAGYKPAANCLALQ